MTYPEYFEGLGVLKCLQWPQTTRIKYSPKTLSATDVDIKVELCGVCGSDVHNSAGRWGERYFPMVPGHEIIGRVVHLGTDCSTGLKLGQRVGVGAVSLSCNECYACTTGNYACCPELILTYNSKYEDGYVSKGGFASHIRVNEKYVFEIPDNIPSEFAGPLLCAGIAAFAPLHRNKICKGSKIGVVGIGGIGHMAIVFGKHLGSEVVAFETVESKRKSVLEELKADYFVDNSNIEELDEAAKIYKGSFDILLITSNHMTGIFWDKLIPFLKFGGKIITTAEPPFDERLNMKAFSLIGCSLEASAVGSFEETKQMFELVSNHNLKVWVEKLQMNPENLATAFEKMDDGNTRFRIVMTDYDKYFV